MGLKRLELTLSIGCKLNCRYCPQELLLKHYDSSKRILEFDDFKKAVSKVVRGGWLIFNGMSEPFLNRECLKMLQYASDEGYNISMATTLVGLHENELESLERINFKGFVLHIPDQENNSKFVFTEEYLRIFSWVCEHIQITGISCHGEVHSAVKGLFSGAIPFSNKMGNRAGNLPFVKKPEVAEGKIICAQGRNNTGYIPEMLPDGSLVLCCQDYGMRHVLGNLLEQDWEEIVDGDEFRKILRGWGENDDLDILCRTCDAAMKWESYSLFTGADMLWPIAIRLGHKIEYARYTGQGDNEILQKLLTAKDICIWGMGAFFKEDFIRNGWYEILRPRYFTDMNITKEMKDYFGERCIEINAVLQIKNLLVILWVRDTDAIEEILQRYNIDYVTVQEIYEKLV